MSDTNVSAHREAIKAFNQRDLVGFLALMDDEIDVVAQATALEGRFQGREGMTRWWEGLLNTFPDWTVEVSDVRDLGETTLAVMRAHGHGAGSEVPLEMQVWQTARWRHGMCISWRSFTTEEAALEDAKKSEQRKHQP